LVGDVRAERGRLLLMWLALTVSSLSVGTVLGAGGMLRRAMAENYLGTVPAHATLELEADVTPELAALVAADPTVRAAEGREVVLARAKIGQDFRPLLLFVVEDFGNLRLNTFRSVTGAFPPPLGSVLLERSARGMAEADTGGALLVKLPRGELTRVVVSGTVHDPGLAPAWQERAVYAYCTRETAVALGAPPRLTELRVTFEEEPSSVAQASAQAEQLAAGLASKGHRVHELRVPPPRQHPHELQMLTVLGLLLTFAILAVVLASVLTATALSALLARQVREIGVMKTLGATSLSLAQIYLYLVTFLGLSALVLAVPLGVLGAHLFANTVGMMLNLTLGDAAVPVWVFLVQAALSVVVPLLLASVPILRATRMPVRAALDRHDAASPALLTRLARLPATARNALRRPARFSLTVVLLATGGALFMTALAVSAAWERNLAKIFEARHYDVEIRFRDPEQPSVGALLEAVPGVRTVELWGRSSAAFAQENRIDVVRTYPDKGHGSFTALAPPPETRLVTLPQLSGRWLSEADERGVVLNHVAAKLSGLSTGNRTLLSLDGSKAEFRVVGVVEEVGSAGVVYLLPRTLASVLGTGDGSRVARVATSASTPEERSNVIRRIELELARHAIGVEVAIPFSELRTAVGDHVIVLIRSLLALALILASVGLLGLGSAMGVSVLERTRELGVLKALGATRARIRRSILGEASFTALVSFVLAVLVSLPLTLLVGTVIGKLGFLAPLPFAIAPAGIVLWGGVSVLGALVATLGPAQRATAMTVRAALVEL
jgi:putative ABC transport system permease protein